MLTIDEFANKAGITRSRVLTLLREKKAPKHKKISMVMFDQGAVTRWLEIRRGEEKKRRLGMYGRASVNRLTPTWHGGLSG